jgi:preprotein translocase subunit SecA
MITNFVNKIKQLPNERTLSEILQQEEFFKSLSSDELKERFQNLKLNSSKDPSTLITSFSIVREISSRTIGLKHYPTQLMGGLILNQGKIAEMKTGEGKTLVATLPACLNALSSKGVHIVTVNDYLTKRDADWMSNIYTALGLKTGLIKPDLSIQERKKQYSCDITYVTNTELGFDFLRDNFRTSIEDIVLRPFHYCIIDEVDSILIDEARTPLILGGETDSRVAKYIIADEISKLLLPVEDFDIDEKRRQVALTEKGSYKIEKLLSLKDLYDPQDPWISYILNAFKANYIFEKNKDYIVQNTQVMIVDEFTGRIMADRRWSGGLHQAIEAKEKVEIQGETQTLGSITYQNFFILYPKISGMTGTAKIAEKEFKNIYNLEVEVIPPAKPLQRQDLPDIIYKDQLSKWKAVGKECKNCYEVGRPVLIGTSSIQNSEILSEILKEMKIPHQVLNARPENVNRESEIIAQAGRKYSLTIATNMAGRGTDIILGGNLKTLVQQQVEKLFESIFSKKNTEHIQTPLLKTLVKRVMDEISQKNLTHSDVFTQIYLLPEIQKSTFSLLLGQIYQQLYSLIYPAWEKESEEIKNLGGLYVIGTQRHDSRRIDNQLRGRAGRQGDPGTTRFFLSLEDDLLRIFGGEGIRNFMEIFDYNDEVPLESPLLTKQLDQAQSRVEAFYFESRKRIFEYDDVLNKQRQVIFAERRSILEKLEYRELILQYAEDVLEELLESFETEEKLMNSIKTLGEFLGINGDLQFLSALSPYERYCFFCEQIWISYELKEAEFEAYGKGFITEIEKRYILSRIDNAWMRHLQKMNILRDNIGWRAYGQKEPLAVYKNEGFELFVEMICEIRYNVVYNLLSSFIF